MLVLPELFACGYNIGDDVKFLAESATSGGYGFRLGKSLALAMVRPDLATVGTELMIDVLDQRLRATILEESPYDPDNQRLRA